MSESYYITMSHLILPIIVAILTAVTATPFELRTTPLTPCTGSTYFYLDVVSAAPVDDVKAALDGLTICLAFKVKGDGRYVFFVQDDGQGTLNRVQFPAKSKVGVTHLKAAREFFKFYENDDGWQEPSKLDDTNLALLSWNFGTPEMQTYPQLVTDLRTFNALFSDGFSGHQSWSALSHGVYPVKFRGVVNLSDAELDQVVGAAVKDMGLAGSIGNINIKRLVPI